MAIMPPESEPRTPDARFFSKVSPDPSTGCWEWTGARVRGGYGKFFLRKEARADGGRKTILTPAHRWAYERLIGPIPKGLEMDHLCLNKGCVNPDHLEPVTHSENNRRAAPRVLVCKWGHPFTPETTIYRPLGRRGCRVCHRASARRLYWRQKAKRDGVSN